MDRQDKLMPDAAPSHTTLPRTPALRSLTIMSTRLRMAISIDITRRVACNKELMVTGNLCSDNKTEVGFRIRIRREVSDSNEHKTLVRCDRIFHLDHDQRSVEAVVAVSEDGGGNE